jgi:starch phosphorylase
MGKDKEKERFKTAFIYKMQTMQGVSVEESSIYDQYIALASVVRDTISQNWVQTNQQYTAKGEKQVYYLSMEFLMGRLLESNLISSGLQEICQMALADLGINLEKVLQEEPDAGLGNGGLGRLAACFLDSMAALKLPGHGCGIRYKYGLFEQKIVDNYQVELPDNWLKDGYIWEVQKIDKAVTVKFGGYVQTEQQGDNLVFTHKDYEAVRAVPYDVPIVGYKNNTVNTLRLWSAEPMQDDFDFTSFNHGDYLKAVEYKQTVGRISKILYPEDYFYEGRLLRLKQEYFFVSAGLQSIIRRYKKQKRSLADLPEQVAIHINDTHPAVAIPELMRLLIDEEGMGWEEAWRITSNTISYTNHTILPEALEKWPVDMFKALLPRIYMIVEEINKQFCQNLWHQYPGEWDKIHRMAVVADDQVHMARLAVVGSYSVNGVAGIHTEILKKYLMSDFHSFFPYKFNNKTNGITHRRWLLKANPQLADLITDCIGTAWIRHPSDLNNLLKFDEDAAVQERLAAVKQENKVKLTKYIQEKYRIALDVNSIFDVHIKRIHAYKRQIMNVLRIIELYNRLRKNPDLVMTPRTCIFAGKAAPGYYIAKQTIKLISNLAAMINNDKTIQDKLKVVFLENYSVSLGELIIPAADVSEQISTASKEASGTGNMKFMMNGALTIGTLDGANVEIKDAVGDDNIFIFGLTADQVMDYHRLGGYSAWDSYNNDERLKMVMEQLVNGFLARDREEFRPIYNSLLYQNDEFFVLKDFAAYIDAQALLESNFNNQAKWRKMSIHNIARSGTFSSDRCISEYAIGIWNVRPVDIDRVK